ncbi:MAG: SpoIIE family protein phosphatase [Oscillospiraceae bacterium]|nr:SpoIIE family protein phosphatase [Oscillospiraceae bacterium]
MPNTPLTQKHTSARRALRTAEARGPQGARRAAVLWQLAALAAGMLLSAGRIYGGACPFGLALLIGCPISRLPAAALGCLAGSLAFQPLDTALKLTGACVAALTGRQVTAKLGKDDLVPGAAIGCGTLLLEQALVSLAGGVDAADNAAILCTALLAAGFGAAIRALPGESFRAVCLWLGMGTACLQRAAAAGFAPGLASACTVLLCCACAGTLEQTAVLSVALAAAVTAATPSLCFAALAAAMGALAAALLCPGERSRCAGVFAAGCVLGALASPDLTGVLALALAAGCGILLFLLCPESILQAVFPPAAPPAAKQSLTGAARRLCVVADTLSDIAATVTAVCDRQTPPRGESYDFVVEYTAQHLCQNCARRNACWVGSYSTAMDGLYALRQALESKGRVELEDLPGQLSVCVHPADLCAAVTHGYRLWCSRRQTRARTSVLRAALTEQYSAMASALAQMAGQLGQAGLPDPRREARVNQLFSSIGLEPLECSVSADAAGRVTAAVTVPRTALSREECRALAGEMSRICRRDFDLPEVSHCRTVTMLRFGELPLYHAVFGLASRPAPPETICGDACEQFCDSSGRAQMLLCDGMGTGKPAAVDGQMAARLTSQLLRAGFAAQSAARLVNVALGLKNVDQESGATLDLLTVDLYTGRAGLFKAGAAPSFLCRGGAVRTLEGSSLPMGVLDSVTGRSTAFTMDSGDVVLMVSDGALCDGTGWLCEQLSLSVKTGQSPQQIADTVVTSAVRRAGNRRDDITAAVLRIEK